MKKAIGSFALSSLFVTACGGGSTSTSTVDLSHASTQDLAQSSAGDMSVTPGGDMNTATGCAGVYTTSTISTMRQGASGCHELDAVVTIAVNSSAKKVVKFYVQDAAGGDYSAVRVVCSSASTTHPCAAFATASATTPAHSVTLKGTYIKSSAANGGFEEFYLDDYTDSGAGTIPAPAALAQTDFERGTTMASTGKPIAAYYFQIANATITDKLTMFDWSPPEYASTSGTCKQFGFGLIPSSDGATAGAACTGTTQPAGQAVSNPKEVLVATDFYNGFKFTSDCVCGPKYMQPVPTSGQGVTGAVTVLLGYDVPFGSKSGYVYVAPMQNTSFNIQ